MVLMDRFGLQGRVAVVTGAASGLSRAIALGFAEAGADLVVADIKLSGLKATASQIEASGRKAVVCQCDIANQNEVAQLFDLVDSAFGTIDILVNGPYASSFLLHPLYHLPPQ